MRIDLSTAEGCAVTAALQATLAFDELSDEMRAMIRGVIERIDDELLSPSRSDIYDKARDGSAG